MNEAAIEKTIIENGALWLALSPLWLEREPREADYARMVREVNARELSLEALEKLYRVEMSPVMARYQLSMAGEWRSFDENILLARLVRHKLKLNRWRRGVWSVFAGLTTMMSRPRFNEVLLRVDLSRKQAA